MFDDDLDVFFDEDEFAHVCTRSRLGESDVQFAGILATVDAELFDGTAMSATHVLRYPTAAVQVAQGDVVRTQRRAENGTLGAATAWRVLRHPDRVVDGAESQVYLTPDPEA